MINLSLFITSPDFRPREHVPIKICFPGGPIEESLKIAKGFGYDAVELLTGDPDAVDGPKIAKELVRQGMKVSAVNSGGLNYMFEAGLVHADPQKEELAFRKYQSIIRLAAQLGGMAHLGVARGPALKGKPMWYYRDRLVEVLKAACEYAREQKVTIALEHTNRFEHNTMNTMAEAMDVVDRVGMANLCLVYDTYHAYIEEADVYATLRRIRGYVRYFHLHDSDRGPACQSHGVLDFERIFAILQEIGFSGYLADGLLTTSLPEAQVKRSAAAVRDMIAKYHL